MCIIKFSDPGLKLSMGVFWANALISAQSNLTIAKPDLFVPSSVNQKIRSSFLPQLSNFWEHRRRFSSISSLVVVPHIHFTHKHCPVCFTYLCLCMLVAPSQKEDLIATVMAGKIMPTHFCATVSHRLTNSFRATGCFTLHVIQWFPPHNSVSSDIQVQSVEELKQQKGYLKLLKKQSKELKELRKKHLKKVKTNSWHRMENNKNNG